MTIQHLQTGIIIATVLVWGRLAIGTIEHLISSRSPGTTPTILVEADNPDGCRNGLDRATRASVSR
ncbi:hypothetical protein V0288_16860 [Pannus brasiliensis CCIBt3594]|uniref:Uncharacterized protein n=1 Tax=Pannus brasiliensis CCIBt3594 TaxID=1427578 RepID=A0AAW9QPI2_9CHRO